MMRDTRLEHLSKNEKAALAEFLACLRQGYADQILHVILFGSKARGDSEPESDVDLLVVVRSDNWRVHQDISHLAFEPMLEHDTLLSTHTIGQDLYARMRRHRTPFYETIRQEGMDLWLKQPTKTSTIISD
jgi:predicted nucleotidyltransferase